MSRLALIGLACLASACAPLAAVRTAPTAGIRFLAINDIYLLDTLRDGTGALSRVAAVRDSLERVGGRVIFTLAGDFVSPSLLSKWYGGRQMIEALDTARVDYATFGNHEFELDRDSLVKRIADSRFRWISSNCMQADGTPFPRVASWDTATIAGTKVGFLGLTIRLEYRRYVRCGDPDGAAHAAVVALRAAGAQAIVAITHQFLAQDSALLVREPAIDLILGGHEHEWHLVRAGARIVAKADANSRSAQFVTLVRDAGGSANGWRATDTLLRFDRGGRLDPATQRVARRWRDSLITRLGAERIVARATAPIDARDAVSRRREAQLGDIVTDAMRAGTATDVALINSGTLRLDDVIAAGPISSYQLESIFLFADETRVVTFTLTGARLRALLEQSVSDAGLGHGAFLQVSGIAFHYEVARPNGSRIVGDVARADGRPIELAESVRVAFDVYPACEGGDGYIVPEATEACRSKTFAPRTVDLLAQYLERTLGGVVAPPPPRRMIEGPR
ncbi:MAG: 5'-nucleotidase C-terminal domain-containing protein [Gemmatimonadaceae bacterium]